MQKNFFIRLVVLIVIAILINACGLLGQDFETLFEKAIKDVNFSSSIMLTANICTNGYISRNGCQWFKFTATAREQYIHIRFDGRQRYSQNDLYSLYVQVYDTSCNKVGNRTEFFYDSTRYVSKRVTVGQVYYLRVSSDYDSRGDYQIGFNTSATPPPITLPAAAIQLTANTWTYVNLPNDMPWFKFTATSSTQYIHFRYSSFDILYVQVYDSSGNDVGSETELYYHSTRYTSRTLMVGQEYYIKVRPYRYSFESDTYLYYDIGFNASETPPS